MVHVFIIFDICIAIVTAAEFHVNIISVMYMNVFSDNERWAGNISQCCNSWMECTVIQGIGIRNGVVLKLAK